MDNFSEIDILNAIISEKEIFLCSGCFYNCQYLFPYIISISKKDISRVDISEIEISEQDISKGITMRWIFLRFFSLYI